MTEWAFITRGFIVASMGAGASILYIVAISAAYVGRFGLAGSTIAIAILLAVMFRSALDPYLESLDKRNVDRPIDANGDVPNNS